MLDAVYKGGNFPQSEDLWKDVVYKTQTKCIKRIEKEMQIALFIPFAMKS